MGSAAILALVSCGTPTAPVTTGTLVVTVAGLHGSGLAGDVHLSGPAGFEKLLAETTTLANLDPGTYGVAAFDVGYGADKFVATVAVPNVEVKVGEEAQVVVSYEKVKHFALEAASAVERVSLGGSLAIDLTLFRVDGFAGEVTVTWVAPSAMDPVGPASLTFAPGVEDLSVTFVDAGAVPSVMEIDFTATASVDGESVTDTVSVNFDLAAVVTTTDDAVPPSPGMLRYLIEDSRTSGEPITFEPDLFGTVQTIEFAEQVVIAHDVIITGPARYPDAPSVVLDGLGSHRLFEVHESGRLELTDVELTNAAVTGTGGAILSAGELVLADSIVSHSQATGVGGGGLYVHAGTASLTNTLVEHNKANRTGSTTGYGGGIYVRSGTLTLTNSRVELNNAGGIGGGIYLGTSVADTRLTLEDSKVSGNTADQGGGGIGSNRGAGAFDFSFLTIEDSEISANTANQGGGILSYAEAAIVNSRISGNTATTGNGGGVRNHLRMSVSGSDVVANLAPAGDYGGLFNDGIMTVHDTTIADNHALGSGGGIYNYVWNGADGDLINGEHKQLTITSSRIRENTAASGGGIYNLGRLSLTDTEVSSNDAAGDGGGILGSSTATVFSPEVTIERSLIIGNDATGIGGGLVAGHEVGASIGRLTILNTTFYGNSATQGGGIYLLLSPDPAADVSLTNTTITANRSDIPAGGIVIDSVGFTPPVRLKANLLFGNFVGGSDDVSADQQAQIHSYVPEVASGGYNFVRQTVPLVYWTPEPSDVINRSSSPSATGLGEHGGPTRSVRLSDSSSLRHSIPQADCLDDQGNQLTVDQRGYSRTAAVGCSVGAHQYGGVAP